MTIRRNFLLLAIGCAGALLAACGGGSSPKTNTNPVAQPGSNVATITVNAGPVGNYVDGAFVTVTVCVPGTSTCQPISDVLVDTGSSGLRIVSSALSVPLPQQKSSSGSPVAECLQFLDSYTWGPVQTGDIQIAGEKASSVPIQVLSDTDFTVPASCSGSAPHSADTVESLGANGLLGVGLFAQDCGPSCPAAANVYFECPSASSCVAISQTAAQQVQNPVALFATDNNGVIVELPAISGAETTVTGSLVFGIGTQSNNGLNGATVYTVDPSFNFTTVYSGQSFSSFLDSGSNGYFFQSTITQCPQNSDAAGFYCPASTESGLTATNKGQNGASGSVTFSVANAVTLFNNPSDSAFNNLGGPGSGFFDWGLPFFFGRNVYTAILGASTPGGPGPYWAY